MEIEMNTDGWRLYLPTSASKIWYSIGGNATTDRAVCLVLNLKKDLEQTGCFLNIYRSWGWRKICIPFSTKGEADFSL